MKFLILDNYDSFTYNLFQFLGELGADSKVVRNDKITVSEIADFAPDRIVISPGPGRPENPDYFGICQDTILKISNKIPTLGICLGHQGIVHAFGGKIVRAQEVMHGKTSVVFHDRDEIFKDIPQSFEVMRYHSLIAEKSELPICLDIIAKTFDETIMGVRHREFPIWGIQFHPESVGTEYGMQVLENFMRYSGTNDGG